MCTNHRAQAASSDQDRPRTSRGTTLLLPGCPLVVWGQITYLPSTSLVPLCPTPSTHQTTNQPISRLIRPLPDPTWPTLSTPCGSLCSLKAAWLLHLQPSAGLFPPLKMLSLSFPQIQALSLCSLQASPLPGSLPGSLFPSTPNSQKSSRK